MIERDQGVHASTLTRGEDNNASSVHSLNAVLRWPVFSMALNLILLLIALATFEFWSLEDAASLKASTAFTVGLSMHSGYSGALKALPIYHLFVFSATHLVYSTLIIQYYVTRAERILGSKRVALVYLGNALIAPVITFAIVFLGKAWFDFTWAIVTMRAWNTNWYVGPSIAVWGCAGFVMKREKKAPLYWLGFLGLIGIAIILKVIGLRNTSDWTSDIAHLVSFIGSAIIGSFVLEKNSSAIREYDWKATVVSNVLVILMVGLLAVFVLKLA